MKLIVGLGNPGRKYEWTRHNVGFEIVDLLANRARAVWETAPRGIEGLIARDRGSDVVLAKPLTFMNASGPAVQGLLQFFKIDPADLFVIVDDVNLELGRLRARAAGSAGGHNGLKSIIDALGVGEFARLRVGVGRGDARRDLADHVLARFEPEERPIVAEAVGRAADAAELFVTEGIALVMNRFNRKEEKEEKDEKEDKEDRE
jgi:PTH1 family peptidyl-tRNA hydrolase